MASLALWILCLLSTGTVKAQTKQDWQYNRFQYHNYKWKAFHNAAFHIYFTLGNDSLCSFVVRELPEAMKRVKHNMGTTLLKAPNIIIYPSTDQLYESNIGLYETEANTLPTFIAKGTRLVITYNGDYEEMKEQLYEALAREVWESQLREGLAEQAKGTAGNDDIPFWYKEGAIRYFARQWPITAEDELRKSYEQQHFTNWQQSISYQHRLSGQAFCYFLSQQYYPLATMQLYSQLKKKKTLVRAIRLITKHPLDTVMAQCQAFYNARFSKLLDTSISSKPEINVTTIPHKKGVVRDVQVNGYGTEVAYVLSKNNTRTVYLYHVQQKETKKLSSYKLPPWINEYSRDIYPLIKWSKEGNELTVVMPIKGKVSIVSYAYTGNKLETYAIKNADGITGITQTSNADYLLSPYRKGQSDVVSFNIEKEVYHTYTNDVYDDKQPAVTEQQKQIAFVSKRKEQEPTAEQRRTIGFKDTTKQKQGLYLVKDKVISPIATDSIPFIHWDKPLWLGIDKLLATNTIYGSERFAIFNNLRSNTPTINLNNYYPVQYHSSVQEISYYNVSKDSFTINRQKLNDWISTNKNADTTSPWLDDYQRAASLRAKEDSILRSARDETPSFLESVLVPKDAKEQSKRREDSISKAEAFDPKKVKPYVLQLHSAYFTAKVNNDYFINRYQPYKNYQGQFKFPELGGMAQGGFTDLLENHHVNIAFRLPAVTEGSDLFIRYENTAKKLDWSIAYFRKVESLKPDPLRNWTDESSRQYPNMAKVKTHYAEVGAHHPLTYYLSADFTEAIRYDRTIFLATDKYSLKFDEIRSVWSITTLAISYNKLQPTVPFLSKGFKAKLTTDVFTSLNGEEGPAAGSTIHLQDHRPIYKYITLVSQFKAGYSGGQSKVLYNLGGTDNNVTIKVDSDVHAPQKAPYAFQTLVTPLRGHLQNTVQGNAYVLFNEDIYFPLFQTLIPLETPLPSINLLQPGLFIDAATAKETWNAANASNGQWYWSYGFSVRTSLAGYPLRLDLAWPGTFNKKPVLYFSLNLK